MSEFDYDLPDERIAKFPPEKRGTTRLLVLNRKTGEIQDSAYARLDEFLRPGDLVILNNTRVMRSRVFAELPDGRERELVVLEHHGNEDDKVMYRGKLHEGDVLRIHDKSKSGEVVQDVEVKILKILGNGIAEVSCAKNGEKMKLENVAEEYGSVPLPPYLHRDATEADIARYQTVWAEKMGSAAAPTASLNMTEDLLSRLRDKGVNIKYLTLHVGLGTFLPIRTDEVEKHEMHSEWFEILEETVSAIRETKKAGGRVIAIGTTVTRTLEFWAVSGKTSGEDNIFIYPGFQFQVVDGLVTNFHAPRSTVLMLASAFAGWENLKKAYEHAVEEKYNFLSYGDSMLII